MTYYQHLNTDPETSSKELSSTIRSVTVGSAGKVIPVKFKTKFPEEFSNETIALIHQKQKLEIHAKVWHSYHSSYSRTV